MTRTIVALLALALVAWLLRREPMPTARLWREPFEQEWGWER